MAVLPRVYAERIEPVRRLFLGVTFNIRSEEIVP